MAGIIPLSNIIFDFRKADGSLNAGGTLEFFENLTLTPKSVFNGYASSTQLSNPLQLNAGGYEPGVWLDSGSYRIRLRETAPTFPSVLGGVIWTKDNVNISSASSSAQTGNAIANGSFEEGTDGTAAGAPLKWILTTYTGSTFLVDPVDAAHGGFSAKCTSAGNGGATLVTSSFSAVGNNEVVVWRLRTKSTVANVRNIVSISWYTVAQVLISTTSLIDDSTTNPTVWTVKSGVTTAPANASFYKVTLVGCSPSNATVGSTWFDSVEFGSLPRQETPNTWANTQTFIKAIWAAKGADIASASSTNIWAAGDGNTVHITGSSTITTWGTAPQAGASMLVIFDGTPQLTYNATTNKLNTNATNYTVVAGDRAYVYAESTTSYVVTIIKLDGTSLTGSSFNRQQFDANGTWTKPAGYLSTSIAVLECWSPGGGGASGNGTTASPGGGGGGSYSTRTVLLSSMNATETITVPAGGAGGGAGGADGAAGGSTTIGPLLTSYGGGGGSVSASGGAGGGGGGDFVSGGNASGITPGAGGGGIGGGGGSGGASTVAGSIPNSPYGGGGAGGQAASGAKTVWGGGGGGGGNGVTSGGISINGGNGGNNNTVGSAPGGGGGGSFTGIGGAGAAGRAIITVYRN